MSELWRIAGSRAGEFDSRAVAYDTYRPRYPPELFDTIVEHMRAMGAPETAVEVGAGTGIATVPLVERGLSVIAVERAPQMAALAQAKLAGAAEVFVGRFEDFNHSRSPVGLVAAFNAWHWVEPSHAVDKAARLLAPGGTLALVWTDVVQYGQPPFDQRLAELGWSDTGLFDQVTACLAPVESDGRFRRTGVHRFAFERRLEADTFVAVRHTYGGTPTAEEDQTVRQLINDTFGGQVLKIEEAVTYLFRRL